MLATTDEVSLALILSRPQNLEGLAWTDAFCLRAYGVSIGVRANNAAFLRAARAYFPAEWHVASLRTFDCIYSIAVSRQDGDGQVNSLYIDDALKYRCALQEDLLSRLESDVRLTVADRASDRVFIHAGVVGWNGKAIVIPGRSHAGKSSLVAEFLRRGAIYYSDEYAVCDSRGRVHPFDKPLELRKEGERQQFKVDIGQIGGKLGTKPLRVGLVLMTQFKKNATWRPRELPPGKGVLELLSQTVSARRYPERAFATFEKLVQGAKILKGTRGEAPDTVDKLLAKYVDW